MFISAHLSSVLPLLLCFLFPTIIIKMLLNQIYYYIRTLCKLTYRDIINFETRVCFKKKVLISCNEIIAFFSGQVKAYNNKGYSNYSDEIVAETRVDRIPAPQRVTFDPATHALIIYIPATCLQLVNYFVRYYYKILSGTSILFPPSYFLLY